MNKKFIRFISKNAIFNKEEQIQFPCDLLTDYKTENNELSIFLLDEKFLNRIIAHFCLMKNSFNKPTKISYIIFEEKLFEENLLSSNLRIEYSPDQIDCGDLDIKHLHYNISNLTSQNIHNLLNFFNKLTKVAVPEKDVKKYLEISIQKKYLTLSSNDVKFPPNTRESEIYQKGFYQYVEDNFPNIKNPIYK